MKKNKTQQNANARAMVSVIGEAGAAAGDAAYSQALELGRGLVDAGFRVCSGGLSGVMTAAFEGARQSPHYKEGDTVAIIPTLNHEDANEFADVVIATGLGHQRNGIVAAAQVVVVVGGKAGTLSEVAMAWRYNRLIIALRESGGVAAEFAGRALDDRAHRHEHPALKTILSAATPQEAVSFITQNFPACYLPPQEFE